MKLRLNSYTVAHTANTYSGMTAEWQRINVISLMWETWKNCNPALQFFHVSHTREITLHNLLSFCCHSPVCICCAGLWIYWAFHVLLLTYHFIYKFYPSMMVLVQSSFHTTWASLFEMELEQNSLDWKWNELEHEVKLENMKRAYISWESNKCSIIKALTLLWVVT